MLRPLDPPPRPSNSPPDEEEATAAGGDLLAGGRWAPAGADLLAGEAWGHPLVETAAPFLVPPPLLTCPVRGERRGEDRSRERRPDGGVGRGEGVGRRWWQPEVKGTGGLCARFMVEGASVYIGRGGGPTVRGEGGGPAA
jgi:hypothetical protein